MTTSTPAVSRTERLFRENARLPQVRANYGSDIAFGFPIPRRENGRLKAVFPIYGQRPQPTGGAILTAPFASVLRDWETGSVTCLRELSPEVAGGAPDDVIGRFPHEALTKHALTVQAYHERANELFGLYDKLFVAIAEHGDDAQFVEQERMRELMRLLTPPGLTHCYERLAPEFARRFLHDAA